MQIYLNYMASVVFRLYANARKLHLMVMLILMIFSYTRSKAVSEDQHRLVQRINSLLIIFALIGAVQLNQDAEPVSKRP